MFLTRTNSIYFIQVKYECSHHQKNCEKFVSVGGLKYVFPALMGRGLVNHHGAQKKDMTKHEKSIHDKAASQAAREMEEAAIAVISSLVGYSTFLSLSHPTRI